MAEATLEYQSYIIAQILDAPFEKAIQIYSENLNLLQEYYFIFSHSKGINYLKTFQDLKLEGIDINYFFKSETLVCLNKEWFVANMFGRNYNLKIEAVISLDTQIQSYLYRRYINKHNTIPKNIAEILKLIKDRKWSVECLAYTLENSLFNLDYLDSKTYKDNAFAFETYFFDRKSKAKRYAKRITELNKNILKTSYFDSLRRQYKLIYLNLLVMANIGLNYKNLNLSQKELRLVDYFHTAIGIVSEREICLAKLFFIYGTKIKFFGKIQSGRNDIIKSLKNMAWDIFHIHNTINNFTIQSDRKVDFTIPYFITYDERLKDIVPIYKIKSIAFIKNGTTKHINYVTDIIDPVIKYKYFTAKPFMERQKMIKNKTEKDLLSIIQFEIEKYEKLL